MAHIEKINHQSPITNDTLMPIILSIIVPIYNVEKYLRKCVDSLLHQDLSSSEYEIILVDDGSTDSCPAICDEYANSRLSSLDSRLLTHNSPLIRVIHQPNAGLSAARNSGIKIANGEYICFLDSDDYWEPNVIGTIIALAREQQLDVLRYNYQNVRIVKNHYEVFEPFKNVKPYFDYSNVIEDGETFLNKRLGYACYAAQFIIKRDLIYSPLSTLDSPLSTLDSRLSTLDSCLFTEGIYFEDTDWTPRMLLKAKRVSSTEKIVYNYLWREGSITLPTDPVKKKKIFEDRRKLLYGFLEQQKLVRDRSWFAWHIASTTLSLLEYISSYSVAERKAYINELKSLHIFPLTTYRAVGNNKWKIRIANISPSLYCHLIKLIRK